MICVHTEARILSLCLLLQCFPLIRVFYRGIFDFFVFGIEHLGFFGHYSLSLQKNNNQPLGRKPKSDSTLIIIISKKVHHQHCLLPFNQHQ